MLLHHQISKNDINKLIPNELSLGIFFELKMHITNICAEVKDHCPGCGALYGIFSFFTIADISFADKGAANIFI
jgi:hypothetical protein